MSPITVLSYDYPPNDGGISRLAGNAVAELARRGRSVVVLTVDGAGCTGLARPAVQTQQVPGSGLRRDLATFAYLRRLPVERRLLATVWNPEASLAWLARRPRLTVMAHGNEVMAYPGGLKWTLKDRLRRRVLAAADNVICNSRYTQGLVHALAPTARTTVICPAVDAARFAGPFDAAVTRQAFGLSAHKLLLLSVSRMDAYKGHDVVLHALAQLPIATRDRLHYTVAGRGSHLPVLQALAAELGVADCVSWLGFVADDALPALYGCADLFLLCTRDDPRVRGVEGFGMAFLEAQAAGVPVVGTAAGGIPDAIVPGEGGWLISQDDVAAVAAHLHALTEDPAPYRAQGVAGRRRVQRDATWEKYVDRLLAVMEKMDV